LRQAKLQSQQRAQHQGYLFRQQLADSRRRQMHGLQEIERLSASQLVSDSHKIDINDSKYSSAAQLSKLQQKK
jgi:hypothetical protein